MNAFQVVYAALVSLITVLAIVAVISRLTTMPQLPTYIKNSGDTVSSLFSKTFGY